MEICNFANLIEARHKTYKLQNSYEEVSFSIISRRSCRIL